jgi:hypothetical protein
MFARISARKNRTWGVDNVESQVDARLSQSQHMWGDLGSHGNECQQIRAHIQLFIFAYQGLIRRKKKKKKKKGGGGNWWSDNSRKPYDG